MINKIKNPQYESKNCKFRVLLEFQIDFLLSLLPVRSNNCTINKNKIAIAPTYIIIYNKETKEESKNTNIILTVIKVATNHNTEYTVDIEDTTKIPNIITKILKIFIS